MPTKKKQKSLKKTSVTKQVPFLVFTENRTVLQLLIIAFITLSTLLVLNTVNQNQELKFYRQVSASSLNGSK